jgi:hypothetical protein
VRVKKNSNNFHKEFYAHTQELCPAAKKFGSGVVSNQTEILPAVEF